MRDIVELVKMTLFFLGFVVPIFWGVWIGFCKYVLHFHRGCNNHKCLYRCNKCPRLNSEVLKERIAVLEQKNRDEGYIALLKRQYQMYLDNPELNMENESKMVLRVIKKQKKTRDDT